MKYIGQTSQHLVCETASLQSCLEEVARALGADPKVIATKQFSPSTWLVYTDQGSLDADEAAGLANYWDGVVHGKER